MPSQCSNEARKGLVFRESRGALVTVQRPTLSKSCITQHGLKPPLRRAWDELGGGASFERPQAQHRCSSPGRSEVSDDGIVKEVVSHLHYDQPGLLPPIGRVLGALKDSNVFVDV